jgi:hypothetical protein
MSIQVSCPVFRCPKNSIRQCEGYGRSCERYYCRTHTEGTLCDRCVSAKLEDMKSNYKEVMKDLAGKALSNSLKGGVGALFIISLLLMGAAVFLRLSQKNSESLLPLIIILLMAGALGFAVALIWRFAKAREYMRSESLELDQRYPGFYDFYQKWQKVLDKATENIDL